MPTRRFLLGLIACLSLGPAQAAPLPPKKSFHVYLLMGQSNMAGRDRRGLDRRFDDARVLALDPDGRWQPAKDPLHPKLGRTEPGVGPGIPFALEMLKADPAVTIGLVPCAVGGTPLRRWVKGGDLYEQAVARAKAAAKDGVIRGVLWHQGESDSIKPQDAGSYGKRLAAMFLDLRADLKQPDLPIVVGQLGEFLALTPEKFPHAGTVRAALRGIPAKVPRTGYADSAGLGHKGDKLHFDTAASTELGIRFARAMTGLQQTRKN